MKAKWNDRPVRMALAFLVAIALCLAGCDKLKSPKTVKIQETTPAAPGPGTPLMLLRTRSRRRGKRRSPNR